MRPHFKWMDRICSLLADPVLPVEVGKFDPAKMINLDFSGGQYQQGPAAGHHDVRHFVFAEDAYTSRSAKRKGKILQTHHIVYCSNSNNLDIESSPDGTTITMRFRVA